MEVIDVPSEPNSSAGIFTRLYTRINQATAEIKKLESKIHSHPATKEAAIENKRIHEEIQIIIKREPFESRIALNKIWPDISK